ncbi:ribonuclease H [Gloeothece citriformis PCC 7424]|uniref:Ribonuclease H n=1 Tax=Gloeothece citriformis (strain PCC 7424) TaxID=65393 RepID=B7KLL7_GLOC7|nr:ribonuclease HI family protein [Gloeothece citriformis]ACK72589.1 ribonuclease H [Gloeothece citriformis PCC 7424]
MAKTGNNIPILYFDGGSRGNPGEAAGAAVIVMANGQHYAVSKYLKIATNNEAEYTGLIIGLKQAQELGIKELIVKGDSQLIINQITGKWKVNSPHLKEFYHEAKQLIKNFEQITLNWIRRNENQLADTEVNRCIDRGEKGQQQNQVNSQYKKVDLNLNPIDKLIKLGKRANKQDYTNLNLIEDEFSRLGLSDLKQQVSENIQQKITNQWEGTEQDLAKVYQWYLRGLPLEMALRKVRIDGETQGNQKAKNPEKNSLNKLTEKCPNTPPKLPYAKGDVIVIAPAENFQLKQQGVIIKEPQRLEDGTLIITINLE